EALELLADQGFDPDYGARPLRRTIRTQVEDPAAELLLGGHLAYGSSAAVAVQGGSLLLTPELPLPAKQA
ncbi:MAG: hypothetical protein RR216_05185, partial [Pseudoflavonifractor sp.]